MSSTHNTHSKCFCTLREGDLPTGKAIRYNVSLGFCRQTLSSCESFPLFLVYWGLSSPVVTGFLQKLSLFRLTSHCGSDGYSPKDYSWWASFHVLVGHLYVIFRKVFIQVLCPFFKWVFDFLLLSCRSYFYILI